MASSMRRRSTAYRLPAVALKADFSPIRKNVWRLASTVAEMVMSPTHNGTCSFWARLNTISLAARPL